MTTLRIGELASKGNVHLETIRYYEREGLLRPPQRTSAGHRAYHPGDVLRLRFIKRSQALGFTLVEIKELLALKVTPNKPCIDVVRQIDAKELEVRAKIAHLQANHHYLQVFGVSIAIGAIAGFSQINTRSGLDASAEDAYRQGVGSSLSQSSLRILDRYLNVLPTYTIREGYRVKVYLAGDLLLPAYDKHQMPSDL